MKLSEAMMLGMCRFRLEPESWTCEDGGCLLGVAALADGVVFRGGIVTTLRDFFAPTAENGIARSGDYLQIEEHWPWISKYFPVPVICRPRRPILPCFRTRDPASASTIISNLAFQVKLGLLPLEEVLAWIRSVEPDESSQAEAAQEPDAVLEEA